MSIENIVEKTFDNFKKITPALVAVAILTGLILFLPQSILAKMNLNELPKMWNQIIGIVFLLCIALIVTIIIFTVIASVTSKRRFKRMREGFKKKYQALSPRQKAIVLKVLRSEDKSIELDRNSGDTIYLVNNLFLHMPNQYVTLGWNNEMILTYVPHPWLLELYNEEPNLFQ